MPVRRERSARNDGASRTPLARTAIAAGRNVRGHVDEDQRRHALCICVRTAHAWLLGKVCECVSTTPQFPQFGSHIFRFQDGQEYYGEPKHVRPITPPPTTVSVIRRRRVTV